MNFTYIKPFGILYIPSSTFAEFNNTIILELYYTSSNINSINFENPYKKTYENFDQFIIKTICFNLKIKNYSLLLGYNKKFNAYYRGIYEIDNNIKSYFTGFKFNFLILNFGFSKGDIFNEKKEKIKLIGYDLGIYFNSEIFKILGLISEKERIFLLTSGKIDFNYLKLDRTLLFLSYLQLQGKFLYYNNGVYMNFSISPYIFSYSIYQKNPFKIEYPSELTAGITHEFKDLNFYAGLGISQIFLTGNTVGILPYAWKFEIGTQFKLDYRSKIGIDLSYKQGEEKNIFSGDIAEVYFTLCIDI